MRELNETELDFVAAGALINVDVDVDIDHSFNNIGNDNQVQVGVLSWQRQS